MRTRGTTRDEGGHREPDLARAAVAIARDEGLEAGERVPSPPGLHRQVVEGGALVRPMVLCVGVGDRDRRPRLAPTVASEHLPEVRELPPRSVRGVPVWAELVEHLPAGSLRRRMSFRAFRVGEAVTVLLAACDVLRRLHEAGYGGVSLRAEDVRFREDGCPVLMGAGGVEPLTEQRARADSAAFVGLARELAASVGDPAGESLVESVRRAVDGRYGGVRETLLRESLPVAVRVAVEDAADPVDAKAPDTAERWVDRPGGAPPVLIGVDAEVPSGVKRSWSLAGVRRLHWRTDVLLDGDPVGAARAAARKLVQDRPKLVLAIAAPLVAGVLALAMLPGGGAEGTSGSATPGAGGPGEGEGGEPPAASVAAAAVGEDVAGFDGSASSDDSAASDGSSPPDGPAPADGSTASPEPAAVDDPAAAALRLLEARPGGARYAGAGVEVTQRWGDAALVRVEPAANAGADSEPASLLVVRSEAGWRIRAVYS